MERTTFQQVDVTPCSNRQEGTEAFMVVSLLYSSMEGRTTSPNRATVGQGATEAFMVCPPVLTYGASQL